MSDPTLPPPSEPQRSAHGVAYERQDLHAWTIGRTVIALFAMIIGVFIFCWIFGATLKTRWTEEAGVLPATHPLPPEPRLEVEGPQRISELRAHEDLILNGSMRSEGGRTRISITRAMELIAQRGLPARSEKAKP